MSSHTCSCPAVDPIIPEPGAAASNCGKRKLQHLLKQLEITSRPRLTAVWITTDAKEARNPKSDGPADGNERRQLSLPQHQDIPFPGLAFVPGDARETNVSTVSGATLGEIMPADRSTFFPLSHPSRVLQSDAVSKGVK